MLHGLCYNIDLKLDPETVAKRLMKESTNFGRDRTRHITKFHGNSHGNHGNRVWNFAFQCHGRLRQTLGPRHDRCAMVRIHFGQSFQCSGMSMCMCGHFDNYL